MTEKLRHGWHLDKRVNLSIIFVLIGQVAFFGWYASKLDSRIESNLEKVVDNTEDISSLESQVQTQINQFARVEQQIVALRRDISRLIDLLDKGE